VVSASERYALWNGRDTAPPRPLELHAGPVTAQLDGADLRYVRVGGSELVQRVYVAVRDESWNTIPAVFDEWVYALGDDRFEVTFRARHAHEAIDFAWQGRITGTPDGRISYALDGRCESHFRYAKIGFNVHHALAGTVGRRYRAQTAEGELRGVLPEAIDPQRVVDGKLSGMFAPYESIAIEVTDGLEAVVSLDGDLLELQDHRNWADANFKSYGTPLSLGYPFDAQPGDGIAQTLGIAFEGAPAAPSPEGPSVLVGTATTGRLPAIGLGLASHDRPLSQRETELLRAVSPAHLRADVAAADADAEAAVRAAATQALALDSALELALHVDGASGPALDRLAAVLDDEGVAVAQVLVYQATDGFDAAAATTPPDLVALVQEHLSAVVEPIRVAGGTDQSFVDLNRDRPTDTPAGAVCFMASPTVHADDDASIVENIGALGDVVSMAHTIAGGRSVFVSPVTLATRHGPYPGGPRAADDLPAPVDPRQASLLGAGWTVGALAALGAAGADAVTFYETTGWRGVIETDAGSPMPERFRSQPGQVFPMYHVFADTAAWSDADLLEVTVDEPLTVAALAVQTRQGVRVLVANLTPLPQRVRVDGLTDPVRVRLLDEAAAELALLDPSTFRQQHDTRRAGPGGGLWLGLGPFAVARLDAA
jgi:hypothetical protein